MKKNIVVFLGLISFFIFGLNARAASKCDYVELSNINQEASRIKVSYEVGKKKVEGDLGSTDSVIQGQVDIYEKYFNVNILNLTSNLYAKVTNENDGSVRLFTASDVNNGVISFEKYDLSEVANLTVKIYTSAKTSCADEEVLTIHQMLPMYNTYSQTAYCRANPDVSVCQEYVTYDVSYEDFQNQYQKYMTKRIAETEDSEKGIANFFKKNKKKIIIGGSIIIVIGVVTAAVVVIKRRRSRLI